MDVNEIEKVVTSLRSFASFLEERGEGLPHFYLPGFFVHVSEYHEDEHGNWVVDHEKTKEVMAQCARAMKPCEKEYVGDDLELVRQFGEVRFTVYSSRDAVCERKQVGTKIIPAKEARIVPAEPEREEPVYEYDCGALLS